jgi:hypothetical protein
MVSSWNSSEQVIDNFYWSLFGLMAPLFFLFYLFLFNKNLKNWKIFFIIFTILYILLWILFYTITIMNKGNQIDAIDNNYLYAFYGLAFPFIALFLILFVLKAFDIKYIKDLKPGEIMTIFLVLTIFGYTTLGIFYYIYFSTKDAYSFPLTSKYAQHLSALNSEDKQKALLSLTGPGLIILASGIALYFNWGGFYSDHDNNTVQLIRIAIIAVISLWIGGVLIAINSQSNSDNNVYTYLLISFTFLSLACLFLPLIYMFFSNHNERQTNKKTSIFFIILSIIAFTFSITNVVLTSAQHVKNADNLEDTNYSNYNGPNYNVLNFSMTYSYSALSIVSLATFLLMFIDIIFNDSQGAIKKFVDTFFGDVKEYNRYTTFVVVFFLFLITYVSWMVTEQFRGDFDKNYLGTTITVAILASAFLIEAFNNYLNKKDQSTFVFKSYKNILGVMILTMPLVSLIAYIFATPKFISRIDDSSTDTLIFGDEYNNNGKPANEDTDNTNSQFSVGANFANYGNGLFVAGGRSNLDLASTRGIRYIANNNNYFNMKYLNNDITTFGDITLDNNALNIFSLEANDIAYGINTEEGSAYWVAVGENIGLTDGNESSIYYNNTAGSNSRENIKNISTLSEWTNVTNGAFSYVGNGVVSGWQNNNSNSNIWVAVGQDQVDYPVSNYNTIKYSIDGKTWTDSAGDIFSGYGNKIAFGPSGLGLSEGIAVNTFVAVGYDYINGHNIVYSTDGGINFTASTGSLFSQEGIDVAYGMCGISGFWVAVGVDNTNPVKYSTTGGTCWADSTFDSEKPDYINAVTYELGTSLFKLVGKKSKASNSGVVYKSINGISWAVDDTIGTNFNEATAISYNLNNINNSYYDKVYYPPIENQQFFVQELESVPIKWFIVGENIAIFIAIVLVIYTYYRVSKDKFINTTSTRIKK